MVENIWLIVAVSIFILVLSNDPKSTSGEMGSTNLSGIFSSATKGQELVRNLTWTLVILFYVLTILKN